MRRFKIGFFSLCFSLFFLRVIIPLYNERSGDSLRRFFNQCRIDEIKKIPENSNIIIGHAYGSPSNNNNFLSPNVMRFIRQNKNKINTLVFSGDIIAKPTRSKWNQLYDFLGDSIEVYIAPGNHDIGLESDAFIRKIFYESPLNKGTYPQKLNLGGNNIILEDSISSNWNMKRDIIRLYKSLGPGTNNIIIRHNIPVRELINFANSSAGLKNQLPSFKELSKEFDDEITIISGDTGAFKSLPRIGCWKYKNLQVIINGIGEVEGDSILLIHKENIFKYKLL